MAKIVDNQAVGGYHGITARMNTLETVIQYEEQKIQLNHGYSRFVIHHDVRMLEDALREKYNAMEAFSFCSFSAALFAVVDLFFCKGRTFCINDKHSSAAIDKLRQIWGDLITEAPADQADVLLIDSADDFEVNDNQVVVSINGSFPENSFPDILVTGDHDAGYLILFTDFCDDIKLLRRNIGFNLCSRRAEKINKKHSLAGNDDETGKLKQKIAALEKTGGENCFLFPTGMSAMFSAIMSSLGDDRTGLVSIGNAYVDTLCIIRNWPSKKGLAESIFIHDVNDREAISNSINSNTAAVVLEIPTNPLLDVADLEFIVGCAKENGAAVIVDSTIATPYNLNPLSHGVNMVVHSTTKYLNGMNDHMGGTVITGSDIFRRKMESFLKTVDIYMDIDDVLTLSRHVDGFTSRMEKINANALKVAEFLSGHPLVREVHFPGLKGNRNAAVERKYMKGSSGLMSFVLKNSTRENAALFYDNIADPIIKGPSLGAEQTMICPYVLLAHYDNTDEELEALGLDRYLIRISVGVEAADSIIANIENALIYCT